jgi:hypothetical protein
MLALCHFVIYYKTLLQLELGVENSGISKVVPKLWGEVGNTRKMLGFRETLKGNFFCTEGPKLNSTNN